MRSARILLLVSVISTAGGVMANPSYFRPHYPVYAPWGPSPVATRPLQAPAYYGPGYYWQRPSLPAAPIQAEPRTGHPAGTPQQSKPSTASSQQKEQVVAPDVTSEESANPHETFLQRLEPLVRDQNAVLLALRHRVQSMLATLDRGGELTESSQAELRELAKKYRVDENPLTSASARQDLLHKIDVIPVSLALAQAANESAWGKSRFALEGNNLFGIWTYDESKGIVPKKRAPGKKHLVRKFDSLSESVAYYMYTLNSHPAYRTLRDMRAEHRARGEAPDGYTLAAGLVKYSAKGEEYVRLIRQIIDKFDLAAADLGSRSSA